ncbi:MAG TPA: thioredoxin-like domain-containing protein [Puia sp.]|nr:thioredoxin-like domain-containing protein [Puia sp.]
MKKLFALFAAFSVCICAFAQQNLQTVKKASPIVPPFHILKIDSATYYTNADLKKHHETLIMYFSPECDHCKHQTKDLIEEMDKLKNIEIVMATYFPFSEMKEFYKNFKIGDYPNIKIGRDEKYTLPSYYTIHSLPFLALYDKKGNLVKTFEGNQKISTLLDAFKNSSE